MLIKKKMNKLLNSFFLFSEVLCDLASLPPDRTNKNMTAVYNTTDLQSGSTEDFILNAVVCTF